jgi:hypothetical protein
MELGEITISLNQIHQGKIESTRPERPWDEALREFVRRNGNSPQQAKHATASVTTAPDEAPTK